MAERTLKDHKAAKKAEKKARQALRKKGVDFVPEGEYVKDPQRELQAKKRKAALNLANASTLVVPPEFTLEALAKTHPDIYKYLTTTANITVTKDMDPVLIKAIWYLELDPKHSFNTRVKVPGANFAMAMICMRLLDYDVPMKHPILIIFALACYERRHFPDRFIDRERFIKRWIGCDKDILAFSQAQTKRIQRATKEMKRQLDHVENPESEKFDSMTHALSDVIEEEIEGEKLTNRGEYLWAQQVSDEACMEMGDTKFVMYAGENVIEEGLSSKSDAYRDSKLLEWVDQTLDVMEMRLEEEEARKDPDEKMIFQYNNKSLAFLKLKMLRLTAEDMGFEEFAWNIKS